MDHGIYVKEKYPICVFTYRIYGVHVPITSHNLYPHLYVKFLISIHILGHPLRVVHHICIIHITYPA